MRVAVLSVAAAALLVWAPWSGSAVTVAPHALFMGDDERVGEVELINASDVAEEVTGSSEAALSVFRLVGLVTGLIAALVAVLMGVEMLTDASVRPACDAAKRSGAKT